MEGNRVGAIFVCVVLGSIGFWYSCKAPAANAALAKGVRWYSLVSWTLAVGIYGIKRLIGRFVP
jgi:hypothetical protein